MVFKFKLLDYVSIDEGKETTEAQQRVRTFRPKLAVCLPKMQSMLEYIVERLREEPFGIVIRAVSGYRLCIIIHDCMKLLTLGIVSFVYPHLPRLISMINDLSSIFKF